MQCMSLISFSECYTPNIWNFPGITRPFSIIYYALGGSAFYTFEGEEKRFEIGHLYILPANRLFSMRELAEYKFYAMYIHVYTLPEINRVIDIDASKDEFIKDTLEMIRTYVKKGDRAGIYVHKMTDMLMSYISEAVIQNKSSLPKRIKEYIEKNFVSVYRENDLSEVFNYSNSHIAKLFRSEYNLSPRQYAEQLVLGEIILLLHKGLPISEISARINFSSPENLCRFFKSAYGCPPSKYIKKYKDFPI